MAAAQGLQLHLWHTWIVTYDLHVVVQETHPAAWPSKRQWRSSDGSTRPLRCKWPCGNVGVDGSGRGGAKGVACVWPAHHRRCNAMFEPQLLWACRTRMAMHESWDVIDREASSVPVAVRHPG